MIIDLVQQTQGVAEFMQSNASHREKSSQHPIVGLSNEFFSHCLRSAAMTLYFF